MKDIHSLWHHLADVCVVASVMSDFVQHDGLKPFRLLFHGILQAGILGWAVMPSVRGSSHPRDQTLISHVFCIRRLVL